MESLGNETQGTHWWEVSTKVSSPPPIPFLGRDVPFFVYFPDTFNLCHALSLVTEVLRKGALGNFFPLPARKEPQFLPHLRPSQLEAKQRNFTAAGGKGREGACKGPSSL